MQLEVLLTTKTQTQPYAVEFALFTFRSYQIRIDHMVMIRMDTKRTIAEMHF